MPGLCAALRVEPLVTILGATTGTGDYQPGTIQAPYVAAFTGAVLLSQFAALEPSRPGLGIAVSNGAKVVVPRLAPAPTMSYLATTNGGSSTTGTRTRYSGIVTQFAR